MKSKEQIEFEKKVPGLKQEMMMEEAIASAELAGAEIESNLTKEK